MHQLHTVALFAGLLMVGVATAALLHGQTTRYWDCCKASCSWGHKAHVTFPVKSCAKDGTTQVNHEMTNVCGGGGMPGHAYMCNDQQPWAVNSSLAMGFAAGHIVGMNEASL